MSDNLVRLHKYIAECGVASRRAAEQLITDGRVRVNDRVVTEVGTKIDPAVDRVFVKNKPVVRKERGIAIFYKPRGVVSTLSDPEGRPCITDYLTKHFKTYFPVGRLDFDTSGLMVLTNDGELAQHMMHPKYECRRIYHARVEGKLSSAEFEKCDKGVRLADGPARADVKQISYDASSSWLEVHVAEGRNRMVRRLFDKLGHSVIKLRRVTYGPFKLGKLEPGQIRHLSEKEYLSARAKILAEAARVKENRVARDKGPKPHRAEEYAAGAGPRRSGLGKPRRPRVQRKHHQPRRRSAS